MSKAMELIARGCESYPILNRRTSLAPIVWDEMLDYPTATFTINANGEDIYVFPYCNNHIDIYDKIWHATCNPVEIKEFKVLKHLNGTTTTVVAFR